MAKIALTQTGMSRLLLEALNERHPELAKLYDAAKTAAGIQKQVSEAAKAAKSEAEEAGVTGESLFAQTKDVAISLAFADNGPNSEPGIAGRTVLDYFIGRNQAEGVPDNTGRSYARLCGQTVEALRQSLVTVEEVKAWTRPDAQRFFASDDAAARSDVKAEVGRMVKGATADYCNALKDAVLAFEKEWLAANPPKPEAPKLVNGEPAH